MTAKAKSLGSVTFLYELWVAEFEAPDNVMSEMRMSAAGSHVVYEAAIETPYITLVSKENGWLNEQNVSDLKTSWADLGATLTLTYDDDTTETVRMAREKELVFTPLYEGACYYTAQIPLAKTGG